MHSVTCIARPARLVADGRKGTSRRAVIVAAGLGLPFLPSFARAAETTWRVAHAAPVGVPMQIRLLEAASVITSRSEGQMTVEVYPDSQLGSPIGLLAQLRAGTIDAALLSCPTLAKDLNVAALPTVGFAFAGYDKLWPAIDGEVGRFIRTQINHRLGLTVMDRCWDFGFRQITTSGKPVNTAADLAGLRLRTPSEADFIDLFQALRAVPLAMPLSLVDRALMSHSIDGQESVIPLVKAAGLSEVLSVCALTNHVWDGQWLCVSGKSWSKLPIKLQDIVALAWNESALRQRQDTVEAETRLRQDLESAGMKFNTVDLDSFRVLLRKSGYYAAWSTKMGDDGWGALEKYTGRLTGQP